MAADTIAHRALTGVDFAHLAERWFMKAYVLSLLTGILVGCFYAILKIRSPAPPLVALVGLLGIVIGETLCSFLMSKA